MTKAIEAARKAVLLEMMSDVDESLYAGGLMSDEMVDKITRAALAAADKVRAEGFDAQEEYDRWLDAPGKGSIKGLMEHCFAAGLAKGDAARAALEKLRDEMDKAEDQLIAERDALMADKAALVGALQWYADNSPGVFAMRADATLALVRKGV